MLPPRSHGGGDGSGYEPVNWAAVVWRVPDPLRLALCRYREDNPAAHALTGLQRPDGAGVDRLGKLRLCDPARCEYRPIRIDHLPRQAAHRDVEDEGLRGARLHIRGAPGVLARRWPRRRGGDGLVVCEDGRLDETV